MHDMTEQLRDCRLDQPHVRLLARSLAEDAGSLDPLIERLVDAGEEGALTALLVAMAVAGRRFDARHLPGAAPLLIGLDHLAIAALHADGDVVDMLLDAVRQNQCGWEREALLLTLAAWICRRRAPERPLPEDLIPLARRLVREAHVGILLALPLFALASVVEDAGLTTMLARFGSSPPKTLTTRLIRAV